MSPVSRSLPLAVAVAAEKLSSPDVSVKVMPLRLARTGVSFAPASPDGTNMTRTRWIWAVLGGVYTLFFYWYTSFGGPLTGEEVEHYMTLIERRDPTPSPADLERIRRFMEEDTGDDFVMVNLIDMYDTPMQIERGEAA